LTILFPVLEYVNPLDNWGLVTLLILGRLISSGIVIISISDVASWAGVVKLNVYLTLLAPTERFAGLTLGFMR